MGWWMPGIRGAQPYKFTKNDFLENYLLDDLCALDATINSSCEEHLTRFPEREVSSDVVSSHMISNDTVSGEVVSTQVVSNH